MIVNPEGFREAALHFKKYGRYDDGEIGSQLYIDYWKRELDRILNGYSSGGLHISGYYYHYLNYCPIPLAKETYGQAHKNKATNARKVGERTIDFPDYWDVDLLFFSTVDIAEKGIGEEQWEFLNKNITVNIKEDQLSGGHHVVYLKPRGVGASLKAASMPQRNQIGIPNSRSFMLASEKEYLNKDGIWTKYMEYREWTNEHAKGFRRDAEVKEDRTNMIIRASVLNEQGTEVGYKSEVHGVSLMNNPQKARGKRGKLILWEELGMFKGADLAWEIARSSVEEGDLTFGTMVGMGTGGVEGSNFESLRKMIYNPRDYNIIVFDNVYDEGRQGSDLGLFTPAYMNVRFKSHNGTSDTEAAKDYFDKEREKADKSKDPTLSARRKAEMPYTPQEAVLNTSENIFASEVLMSYKNNIEHSGIYKTIANVGEFERGEEGVLKFVLKSNLKPIYSFPHTGLDDISGAVVILENPLKINGQIPRNLYQISVDTYRHESITGPVKSFRGSIGAIYVTMNINNITGTGRGDRIVAYAHGKPATQDDFNKRIFDLAEYFGCIEGVAFENDEPGDVVGYAKRKKKLMYLANEFELGYDDNLKSSSTRRGFGMHMGSGKDAKRIRQGDLFLKDWLYTVRFTEDNGKEYLNLHTVKDLGALQELCSYNPDGNFDRISALRIMVYHQQELLYNEKTVKAFSMLKSSNSEFFKRKKYV